MTDPHITALFDAVAAESAMRPQFSHAMSREAAQSAIEAILWVHGSRPTDAASICAYDALYRALGIDWGKSTLVPLSEGDGVPDKGV